MPKRSLRPDEKRAWARVAKTVRPRAGQAAPEMPPMDVNPMHPAQTAPSPANAPRPPQPAARPSPSPASTNTAPIPNRGKERRVRRGQAPISATLDLHGHTQQSAQKQLVSFLLHQRQQGARCVLVITGKGRLGEGVLRRRLLDWLGTANARQLVSGYAEAHRKHGGAGAWYLFLRKSETN